MAVFVTAEPIHPGEHLNDMLTALKWTHEDLSAVTGISRRQIINLIQGKSGITPETAIALAAAFGEGHEAIGWMNLQAAYELSLAAQKDRDVERRAAVFRRVAGNSWKWR
jgi:HTH-type transcriptional regulator/antitoxin HigA